MKRLTRQDWVSLVRRVDRGEPLAIVANSAGVRPKTLTWWRWKLKAKAPTPTKRAARHRARPSVPALLPVVVADAVEAGAHGRRLRLQIGDASLVFSEGTSPEYVAALARALRAC